MLKGTRRLKTAQVLPALGVKALESCPDMQGGEGADIQKAHVTRKLDERKTRWMVAQRQIEVIANHAAWTADAPAAGRWDVCATRYVSTRDGNAQTGAPEPNGRHMYSGAVSSFSGNKPAQPFGCVLDGPTGIANAVAVAVAVMIDPSPHT